MTITQAGPAGTLVAPSRSGVVTSVEVTPVGSTVTADAAADALVLEVDDNQAFRIGTTFLATFTDTTSETGQAVAVGQVASSATFDDATTVTLTAPLGIPAVAFDTVLTVTPARQVTTAFVDDGIGAEPLPCVVIHTLQDALPAGPRDDGTGETVVYERAADGQLQVIDITAAATVRDLSDSPQMIETTALAASAEARATGKKLGALIAGTADGPRAEVNADASGGYFRLVTALGEVLGLWQIRVEDGVARLSFGTGGAGGIDPVRLRFRASEAEKIIEALCNVLEVFGQLKARSLLLQQSAAALRGSDSNPGVERVTSSTGVVQISHLVNGTASLTVPMVRLGSSQSVHPRDVVVTFDGTQAGGIVQWKVCWSANNGEGQTVNTPVVNKLVTFDWTATRHDR